MKRFGVGLGLSLALALSAMAGEWSGYISDASCAAKQGAKVASASHAACAKSCIGRGDAAVLVTEDGTVYKIANKDQVAEYAGQKVTISGNLSKDTITVAKVTK
jgi:hypothetical protein